MFQFILVVCALTGACAVYYAWTKSRWVASLDPGTQRMQAIADHIRIAAHAFLKREYTVLAYFVVAVALLWLLVTDGPHRWVALCFIVGAILSGLAGLLGMNTATLANVRTTQAAHEGTAAALQASFSGGTVMGMYVVGFVVLGGSLLLLFLTSIYGTDPAMLESVILPNLLGYAFGGSSVALFARVGGGIYTKSADVGADTVGKVEKNIPEDDPRNPAVIADLVGDNVGDVCGMGADLFESYAASIVVAATLAATASEELSIVLYPFVVASIGIMSCIIGTFFVDGVVGKHPYSLTIGPLDIAAGIRRFVSGITRVLRSTGIQTTVVDDPQASLNSAMYGSSLLVLLLMMPITLVMLPAHYVLGGATYSAVGTYVVLVIGLVAGITIGKVTEYYTSGGKKPVQSIVDASETGAATNVIAGLMVGKQSVVPQLLCIMVAMYAVYALAGLYGIALAAVGMLSTTGTQLGVDAYGPIADNAGGIAEMAGLHRKVRECTDALDSLGNTTAATGKGFAIGSAVMTALALFSTYTAAAHLNSIDFANINTMIGGFVGCALVTRFTSDTMGAVGNAARVMIDEVRRQFHGIPGLLEGTEGVTADYACCVDIATRASLREMLRPCLMIIVTPVVVGFVGGTEMLGGLLVGLTLVGSIEALSMANSGGAWDNAKKWIEQQSDGKNSLAHKAAVVGDTVGDPYKDTSGPALNIAMKIVNTISLMMVPFLTLM